MKRSIGLRIALGAALAGSVAGCQSESRNIPNLTAEAASKPSRASACRGYSETRAIRTATPMTFTKRTD